MGVMQRVASRERLARGRWLAPRPRQPWRHGALMFALLVLLLFSACGQTSAQNSAQAGGDASAALPQPARAAFLAAQSRARAAALAAQSRERLITQAVDWYLAHTTLDEQLGQMLLTGCSCGGGPGGPAYTPDFAYMVEQQHITGVILFGNNYGTFDQTRAALATAQAHAAIPLFVATDQEGGSVSRVDQYFGPFPSARSLGDSGDPRVAEAAGQRTAHDLQQLGINTDFAPVVDMPINGGGYWGPWRSFADDPTQVARYAGAFLRGLQESGEIGTLKHFPGIGSIAQDPHQTLPVVSRTLDQFQQSELVPYSLLIPQAPGMIMATDVLVPSVDPALPAELSPAWIDGMLRQRMGYDGVVITDSLWMGGISSRWSLDQAAVLAVIAGCDVVLAAYDSTSAQAVLDALRAAIAAGRITPARIAQSVRRILTLKIAYGLLPIPGAVLAGSHVTSA